LKGGAKNKFLFEDTIKTDGVSMSFIFTRIKPLDNLLTDPQTIGAVMALGFRVPAGYEWSTALADVDPELVVGVDPAGETW
jgi:hypothetical protein